MDGAKYCKYSSKKLHRTSIKGCSRLPDEQYLTPVSFKKPILVNLHLLC